MRGCCIGELRLNRLVLCVGMFCVACLLLSLLVVFILMRGCCIGELRVFTGARICRVIVIMLGTLGVA